MTREAGETALVTGAASGIGRQLVGELLARGDRVVATDVDEQGLAEAARADGWPEERLLRRRLDVRDAEAWERVVAAGLVRWERLDRLFNVAGMVAPAWLRDATPDEIDAHLDVNAKGVILGTRAVAEPMVRQGHGHVVNMGSLGSLAPVPGLSLYTASKFAVRGFTLAVAEELRPHGIAVTLVMPDAVATPLLDLQRDREEAALTFSGKRPLTPGEVAREVVERVLPQRPLEITVPRSRGGLARIAGGLPALQRWLAPLLRRRGLARQASYREATGGERDPEG